MHGLSAVKATSSILKTGIGPGKVNSERMSTHQYANEMEGWSQTSTQAMSPHAPVIELLVKSQSVSIGPISRVSVCFFFRENNKKDVPFSIYYFGERAKEFSRVGCAWK
eukprot:scaffold1111_cov65-Attheya_sp.AAC.5